MPECRRGDKADGGAGSSCADGGAIWKKAGQGGGTRPWHGEGSWIDVVVQYMYGMRLVSKHFKLCLCTPYDKQLPWPQPLILACLSTDREQGWLGLPRQLGTTLMCACFAAPVIDTRSSCAQAQQHEAALQQAQRQAEQQAAAASAASLAAERCRVEAELLQRKVQSLEGERQEALARAEEDRAAAQDARKQVRGAGPSPCAPVQPAWGCRAGVRRAYILTQYLQQQTHAFAAH